MIAADAPSSDEARQRKQRVKARWGILRRALLASSSTNNEPSDANTDSFSMNSFPGFGVLNRKAVDESTFHQFCTSETEEQWNIIQNSYTANNTTVQFHTREVTQQSLRQKREALLSHRKFGVDNTGNVRVWDAESTLAGLLLDVIFGGDEVVNHRDLSVEDRAGHVVNLTTLRNDLRSKLLLPCNNVDKKTCNILELGAGQAGLAGLALAAASKVSGDGQIVQMKSLQLLLTDGHPNCVQKNSICAQMMKENQPEMNNAFNIDTQLLLWDSSQKGLQSCQPLLGSYDLCLASDCVHFQEYHDGLFMIIARTLVVDGIALLCQPKRGSSLENFMSLVNYVNTNGGEDDGVKDPLFEMFLLEDFHSKVSEMHNNLHSNGEDSNNAYNPNWHRPLLLCLRKMRPYYEEVDGSWARQHVKSHIPAKRKTNVEVSNRLAPYNPSHSSAQNKALELLNLQSNDVLFDLGCGDGRLLVLALEAALQEAQNNFHCVHRDGLRCVGIEYDKTLAESAKSNIEQLLSRFGSAESLSERACIRCDDVMNEKERRADDVQVLNRQSNAEQLTLLNDATAVFLYLVPDGLKKVKPLLVEAAKRRRRQRELEEKTYKVTPPFRVVSYMFSIPGWQPVARDTSSKGGCQLNYYEDVDLLDT